MNNDAINNSNQSLVHWIEHNRYTSYDHYDFLSTKFGIIIKRLFSINRLLDLPCVALIFVLDTYLPQSRRLFAEKARSAEAIPRIASAYFRLFQQTGDSMYVDRGCKLLKWLQENGTTTKHGIGWGLHFDWEGMASLPKSTPCVTLTAYSTEAFLAGYQLTGEKTYLDTSLKTSDFVAYDLNRRNNGSETALSYTPLDHNYVINANSYAARILVETLKYYDDPKKLELVDRIVSYVLAQQNSDGSWYYFDRNDVPEKKNFIDSFHTCFVLVNLLSIWKWNNDGRLKRSIDRGYRFFKENFINSDFSIRYYYSYPYPTGIKVDIRGCAEAIHCLALLSEIYPEALELSTKVAEWTIKNMQDKSGYFYFRIYRTHKHKMPYIRWGQAPMLDALTCLLTKMSSTTKSTKDTKNGIR